MFLTLKIRFILFTHNNTFITQWQNSLYRSSSECLSLLFLSSMLPLLSFLNKLGTPLAVKGAVSDAVRNCICLCLCLYRSPCHQSSWKNCVLLFRGQAAPICLTGLSFNGDLGEWRASR